MPAGEDKDLLDLFYCGICSFVGNLQIPDQRNRSWEQCYSAFRRVKKAHLKSGKPLSASEIKRLCLELGYYLASWGMFRNSFLLNRDCNVHTTVVQELFKPDYNDLWHFNSDKIQFGPWKTIDTLKNRINEIYRPVRNEVYLENKGKAIRNPSAPITSTLISKILMGTFGCVPAYDKYFISGINYYFNKDENSWQDYKLDKFCKESFDKLVGFYNDNSDDFHKIKEFIKEQRRISYPEMKLLDMGFWSIGMLREKHDLKTLKGKYPKQYCIISSYLNRS